MMSKLFEIGKADVYREVAKTTSYGGAKETEDEGAYERVFTTDEDQEMLERFWSEAKDAAVGRLKKVVEAEGEKEGVFSLRLTLSSAFDEALEESMARGLKDFFVLYVTGKWLGISKAKAAEEYLKSAAAVLEEIGRKAFYKKAPVRPQW